MHVTTAAFFAILFAALALVPSGAHLAELVNKMRLPEAEYRVAQQIYRGWGLFGIVVLGALVSSATFAVMVRHQPRAFMPAVTALLSLVGTQVVFWMFTFPVNRATANWTLMPANWIELRAQWEYSHAASAALNLVALIALILAVLRRP